MALISRAAVDNKPEVKSLLPFGVRAGRTTIVHVYGDNLSPNSVKSTRITVPVRLIGMTVTDDKTKSRGSRDISVELKLPIDTSLESFDIVLYNPDGSHAGASVPVVEDTNTELEVKKPAATFAQAMLLTAAPVAVSGTLDGDTADVFQFEAKVGETFTISLLAGRAGSLLDPVLRVRDANHVTLMLSAGDKKRDRKLIFKPAVPGPYYIDITDAEARGGKGYEYRLTLNRTQ